MPVPSETTRSLSGPHPVALEDQRRRPRVRARDRVTLGAVGHDVDARGGHQRVDAAEPVQIGADPVLERPELRLAVPHHADLERAGLAQCRQDRDPVQLRVRGPRRDDRVSVLVDPDPAELRRVGFAVGLHGLPDRLEVAPGAGRTRPPPRGASGSRADPSSPGDRRPPAGPIRRRRGGRTAAAGRSRTRSGVERCTGVDGAGRVRGRCRIPRPKALSAMWPAAPLHSPRSRARARSRMPAWVIGPPARSDSTSRPLPACRAIMRHHLKRSGNDLCSPRISAVCRVMSPRLTAR